MSLKIGIFAHLKFYCHGHLIKINKVTCVTGNNSQWLLQVSKDDLQLHSSLVAFHTNVTYLAKTSPDSTHPIIVPRCGILFTYGNADDINTLRSPGTGNLRKGITAIIFKHFLTLLVVPTFLSPTSKVLLPINNNTYSNEHELWTSWEMVTKYFNVLSQHWLQYPATYPQKSILILPTLELFLIIALSNMNIAPKAISPNFVQISTANT